MNEIVDKLLLRIHKFMPEMHLKRLGFTYRVLVVHSLKIWVDQGGEFYKNLFQRFLKINKIETYSTYNEGKSVVAERSLST